MKHDERKHNERKQEILSYLPDFDGLSVVELGCGYGAFTGYLANRASAVLAVDYLEKSLTKNKNTFINKYPHIDYLCRDVTKLDLDDESYDFIFSPYKITYDDHGIHKLAQKLYKWCTVGGYIFFCESCKDGESPNIPNIFDQKKDLQRISANKMKIYTENKNKHKTNQYCFLYKKNKDYD